MKFIPGDIVPQSGVYQEFDKSGDWVSDVFCVRETFFPPLKTKGVYYKIKVEAYYLINKETFKPDNYNTLF